MTGKCELVLAQAKDLHRCIDILRAGRDFQRAQGFVQWPDGFPNEAVIRSDIRKKLGYVVKVDDVIAAYLYLGFDGDPSYPQIKGAWQYDDPYAVIHRIAIADEFRGMGLADITFRLVGDFCKEKGVSLLRIGTHERNTRMQHVLDKNGFVYCGIVIQDSGERLAYEKKL